MSKHAAADVLQNVIHHALHGEQVALAEVNGLARRYRASVAPFASLDENTPQALDDLAELVPVGDAVFVLGDRPPESSALKPTATVPLLQMAFPRKNVIPNKPHLAETEELACSDTAEMMELIAIAFPGYFREETCQMGRYFGIREQGRLVAMGGERMVFEADGVHWRELSALATHPDSTGRGLGSALMQHVLNVQRALGAVSFLHVIESNVRAIYLYENFGFETVQKVEMHKLERVSA